MMKHAFGPFLLLLSSSLVAGCNPHPTKPVAIQTVSTPEIGLPLDLGKKVDVLLVVDNSGSMGDEQANLAANFGPFIEQLEAAGADFRIGITTTDLGGPNCATGGSGGELHLSSCLDRPQTFSFNGQDEFEAACASTCGLDGAALEISATTIETADGGQSEAAPRPWIQSYNGVSNLPAEVDTLDAFQCFAPQGISGCGWESPLEATARALTNMQDPARPEHGFLRDDALLAVLIITDEVDCSHSPEHIDSLFTAETFWSPGASYATSAVCWNAGVACSGASPYEDCWAEGFDASGQPTTDPSAMMLRSVEGYVDQLQAVADAKLDGREVLVSVIAGVPQGFSTGEVEQVFADSEDPEVQKNFGIGAGCSTVINGVEQTAVPPVRLLTLASAFESAGLAEGARNVYSVCESDYTPAILDIVAGIEVELPPACFPGCVLDLDSETPELDYSCEVLERRGAEEYDVPECLVGATGYELPDGVDVCWIAKTGPELAEACVAAGSNLEVELLRRPGVSIPADTEASALCELSAHPSVDCG